MDANIDVVCVIEPMPHGVHEHYPVRLTVHWPTFYQRKLNEVNNYISLEVVAVPYFELVHTRLLNSNRRGHGLIICYALSTISYVCLRLTLGGRF